MVEHVNPDLAVGKQLRCEGILEHLQGREGRDDHAAFLEKVLRRLPSQLKGKLEALDDSLFLKEGKWGRSVLQRIT